MKLQLTLIGLIAAIGLSTAQAHDVKTRADKFNQRFAALDGNKNGALDRNEACAVKSRFCKKFDLIDSNRDGQITQEEIRAFRSTQQKPHRS